MKVNLIILGAQKCATTSLFDLLVSCDGVCGARPKEPHFFSTVSAWRDNLATYESCFRPGAFSLFCEASTSYTFYPHRALEIWHRLFEYNPEMKLIYLVRNPLDRLRSA